MSLFPDPFDNNPQYGFNKNLKSKGLKSFENSLEKHFFSQVNINLCSSDRNKSLLAIELNCNLSLLEMLFHFNNGDWGRDISLDKLVEKLSQDNKRVVDIEEFSIHLKDISIVINRIYSDSITNQLKNILTALGKHYVHFTKGLLETPYEIFIPVFEESNWETDGGFSPSHFHNFKKDYFDYWGIYYASRTEANIYDLKNQALISGELYTLNR